MARTTGVEPGGWNMKPWAGSLLLLLGTTFVLWLTGEIVLRRMVGANDDTPLYTSSADPFVPRLVPFVAAHRNGVEIRTNALGLRGLDIETPKRAGRRVVCLGDSYTFGTGVREEETIPARLAEHLGVEVINAGIEGANAYDNEARLTHIALGLEPDLVVLFYLFNDVHRMERGREWMAARRRNPEASRRAHDASARRSLVVDYLRSRLAALARRFDRSAGRLGVWNDQYRDEVPAWRNTRESLLAMRDVCRDANVPFVIAIMPAFARLTDEAYPLPDYRREVRAFSERSGIPCIDLHAPFWGESGRRYWINPLDPHPDGRASRRLAAALAESLGARALVPADG